jgi:hypothetical protein
MSEENVEIVRTFPKIWNDGNMEGVKELFDPTAVLEVAPPLNPGEAHWQDTGNGSLAVLPYSAVAGAPAPDEALLQFFESAYLAGARAARCDLEALARTRA